MEETILTSIDGGDIFFSRVLKGCAWQAVVLLLDARLRKGIGTCGSHHASSCVLQLWASLHCSLWPQNQFMPRTKSE